MSFISRIIAWIKGAFKKSSAPTPAVEVHVDESLFLAEWAAFTAKLVGEFLPVFDSAKDVDVIYPGYRGLSRDQKIKVWVEFFKWLTFFECKWDPTEADPDVGEENDKDTWSVGLLQLSVTDQPAYSIKLGYTFEDLKDPIKNLNLGIRIMAKIIARRGKVIIPKGEEGLYWATLHPGGKYDETAAIVAKVKKLSFEMKQTAGEEPAWLTIARGELGVSETSNPKRVLEYHAATSLKEYTVKTAWCSSFLTWCFKQVGIKGVGAWARDWLNWGIALDEPRVGCIAVYERNEPGGDSHVALWLGNVGAFDRVINGNVGDKVCESLQPKEKLLGYRWPKA